MDVIEMAVRNQDRVAALDFEAFGVGGIPIRPRIQNESFIVRKDQLECAVTKPCYIHISLPMARLFHAMSILPALVRY